MDYVTPQETANDIRQLAVKKASLSATQLLLRGVLAGGILAYATSLAMIVNAQGLPPIVAAICFPAGFVILVLLGCELGTGNFALMPMGYFSGDVTAAGVLRNWGWVYLGNLLGSVGYALLFYLAVTNVGTSNGGALADQLRHAAQAKTLAYQALGTRGLAAVFVKAMLCNWMVTIGAVLALMSRSTMGKVIGMWLPIATFFAHGYEHSIVNMFVVPAGMLLGAPVSMSTWWMWNQIPVTIGNIVSGVVFTGAALYALNPKPRADRAVAAASAALAFGSGAETEPV